MSSLKSALVCLATLGRSVCLKLRRVVGSIAVLLAAIAIAFVASVRKHPGVTSSLVMGHNARSGAASKSAAAKSRLQRVARLSRGTYFGQLITDRDSVLERWPDRIGRPIRVWISTPDSIDGWKIEYRESVTAAFQEWSATGIPVRFDFVDDSASAEVRVFWAESLDGHTAGMTFWQSDSRRWMRSARITIAMRASDGGRQNARGIGSIALHEVGHLLGLSHSPHSRDIMAPWVTAKELSPGDRATVRLLYALPAGRI
jgi:hypothetical protein